MTQFTPTIGLEIHAHISTKTKMFCSCSNDSFNKSPNINTCPICMGFPGMLPVINEECVLKGIKAALALNCEIKPFCRFDRKNYFYPDLPKGYQISQYDKPLAEHGFLEILIDGKKKKIGITRLHLEDDAGKLSHVNFGTLCDYNRSGAPLMEIVSEPEIESSKEASLYAKEIQKILRTVGSSDCDMEKGMMRFDINVSVKPEGQKEFGVKAEVKNLNSFRALEKCLEYEIKRQIETISSGGKIIQETRGWDDDKEVTVSQRVKEGSADYRYFPEPDLPPLTFEKEFIEKIKKEIPLLPSQIFDKFVNEYKLTIDDANLLSSDNHFSIYFEKVIKITKNPVKTAPWILSYIMKFLNEDKIPIKDFKITPSDLADLILLVEKGDISIFVAKDKVLPEMYQSGKKSEEIIKEKGLKQVSDVSSLETICKKVIESNPKAVTEYKSGIEKAFGFLIGQVMKESKGQANPNIVNEVMKKLLG